MKIRAVRRRSRIHPRRRDERNSNISNKLIAQTSVCCIILLTAIAVKILHVNVFGVHDKLTDGLTHNMTLSDLSNNLSKIGENGIFASLFKDNDLTDDKADDSKEDDLEEDADIYFDDDDIDWNIYDREVTELENAVETGEMSEEEADKKVISNWDIFEPGFTSGFYNLYATGEIYTFLITEDDIDVIIPDETEKNTDTNSDKVPSTATLKKIDTKLKFTSPVKSGWISSPFGFRDHPIDGDENFHHGLDIAAESGSDVMAVCAGTVIETGKSVVFGYYAIIEHDDGFTSFYAHMQQKNLIQKGKKVKSGDRVGIVGSTGISTGPHLHLEIRYNNVRLNPEHYIKIK